MPCYAADGDDNLNDQLDQEPGERAVVCSEAPEDMQL